MKNVLLRFFIVSFLCMVISSCSANLLPSSGVKNILSNVEVTEIFKKTLENYPDILYTIVPRGVIISVPDKYLFSGINNEIELSGKSLLNYFAEIFKKYDFYCVIEGSTKAYGDDNAKLNLELSVLRSEAVAKYLSENCAVSYEKIFAIGFGRIKPFRDNVSYKYDLDRRIDFIIINYEI